MVYNIRVNVTIYINIIILFGKNILNGDFYGDLYKTKMIT